MRTRTRIIGVTAAGALAAAGCIASPAQAAPIVRPVTSGFAQFVIDAPAGVQSDWITAGSPGRVTPQGLIFPIESVSLDGTTVALKGTMVLRTPTLEEEPFAVSLTLDRSTRDIQVALSAQAGTSIPVFYSTRMKVTNAVKVDKAKKTRTTTTTWTGDLRLYNGTSSGQDFAASLNAAYRVTSFSPGMSLGQMALKVSTTAPCKNAACTK